MSLPDTNLHVIILCVYINIPRVCFPGEARFLRLPVGHGRGGIRRSDGRRLHTDGGREQHQHQRLRHGAAARQSLQRPLLSEVCEGLIMIVKQSRHRKFCSMKPFEQLVRYFWDTIITPVSDMLIFISWL